MRASVGPPPLEQHPGVVRGAFADLAWLLKARQGRVLGAVAISLGIGVATDAAIYLASIVMLLLAVGFVSSMTAAIVALVGWFAAYGVAIAIGSAMTLTNAATVIMPAVDDVDPRATLVPSRPGVARWAAALGAALVAQAIVGVGFFLCLLPGLVAYVVFLTTPFERAVDPGVGVLDAVKRAARRFMSAPGSVILLVLASMGVGVALVAPGFLLSLIADATKPKTYYGYASTSTSLLDVLAGLLVLVGLLLGIVLYQVLISLGLRRLLIAQSAPTGNARGADWDEVPPPFGQAPASVAGPASPPTTPAAAPAPPVPPAWVAPAAPAPSAVFPTEPEHMTPPALAPQPEPQTPVAAAAASAPWPLAGEEGDLFSGETVRRPGRSTAPRWTLSVPGAPPTGVRALTLVGRHPEPTADDTARYGNASIRLVAVVDTDRLVSKTHLAIGVDADGAWALDRGSTNGTDVITSAGRVPMRPGDVVRITETTTFDIGEVLVTVSQASE